MKSPIFVLGPHKSGTTLLTRLFDGYPDIFSLPFETHAFSIPQITWIDYVAYPSRPQQLTLDEMRRRYIKNVIEAENENLIDNGNYVGISQKKNIFEKSSFLRTIREKSDRYVDLIRRYFKALKKSSGRDDESRIVEKSVEHHGATHLIKQVYPDAKFVRIMRNPYSNLVSFMRHVNRVRTRNRPRGAVKSLFLGPNSWYPIIYRILKPLISSYRNLERNALAYPQDHITIKYEDLVSQPEKTMRKVANHVGIEFDDILLKPTIEGELWMGNSTRDVKYEGISDKYVNKWRNEIDHLQVHFTNRFCKPTLEKYGYEVLNPKKSILMPARREWISTYLTNRISYRLEG